MPPPRRRLVPDPRLDPRTVWERIATAGTRSHEAYAAGMSRLSCRFCVLSSRADLVCSARLNPDPADRYTEIERRIGHRFRAVDFQFDSTTDGRPIKIVSIIDEHTRECLGGMVERSITGERLIDELDRLAASGGTLPAVLRCDNGPELACSAMAEWAAGQVGLHFIPPGYASLNRLIGVIGFPRHAVSLRFLTVVVRDGICTSHDEGTVRGCGRRRRLAVARNGRGEVRIGQRIPGVSG